jgi:SAM-dependent methyltransferase
VRTGASLTRIRRDWTRLGEADPLWAVCVDPEKKGGRWNADEFLATGRREIGRAVELLDRHGLCPRRDRALDFGCGAGRLTAALADHFRSVTGVDISLPMLARARQLHAGNTRCEFVPGDRPDLGQFADGAFDLVYSSLVLQHLPTELARGYLAEFVRVIRPDGAIMVLVPERHRRTPRGLVYAHAPDSVIRWVQHAVYRYPAPMRMHTLPASQIAAVVAGHGGRLALSVPHPGYGGPWQMMQHVIVKAGPGGDRGRGTDPSRPGR